MISLLSNVSISALLLSITMTLLFAGGMFFSLVLAGSSLAKENRAQVLYDTLRQRAITKIKFYQRAWKVEWFDNFEMWLMVIGNGLKPKYDPYTFLICAVSFGLCVLLYFFKVTSSFLLAGACGFVAFMFPLVIIYVQFLGVASATRKVFLPFVDAYTQTYLDYDRIVTLAFKEIGDRCPEDMRSVINYINLCIADSTVPFEKSIYKLAEILNFGWAHDFVSIVISGKSGEYKSIEGALNNLSFALWAAKSVDAERNSTIKVVFMAMIILTIIAFGIMNLNMEFLKEAKQIYFATPEGINFLTISVIILMVSFLGALIWSKKGDRL
ncbi:hypothetical protein [Brevibacillus reuszeri]|uniref:hypothetical protein n=1 Tax=Brevibacillus reuszeri TaxID=54915 RepID=UPI003D1986D1